MLIELNLRAKASYEEYAKRERRNQMRQWRNMDTLNFANEHDFKKWLAYTKWHKRPVSCEDSKWGYKVKFLDYKPKKNAPKNYWINNIKFNNA